MYTALYRAERPEVFEEILGQEHIVKILKHQISADTVGHAYLFCGTRGTGKTTTARLLAKGVNCTAEDASTRPCGTCPSCRAISEGSFMDVIEIDAASNNGVDNIRELRESVKYPPAVGRKKVYIIDEVHMLSAGAFNALLKTLEEPPEDVMFILATTEPHKLPATILSRCMRLDFKRVPQQLIMDGMKRICNERKVEITEGALKLLANCADGSVRDGLSVLDQVLAAGDSIIDRERVLEYIGTAGEDFFIELTEKVSVRNAAEALSLIDEALADGKDVRGLMRDWMTYYRNLMITKFVAKPEELLNMSIENIKRIKAQSDHISLDEINSAIMKLAKAVSDARWSPQPRVLLELAAVNIATGGFEEAAAQTARRYTPVQRESQGGDRLRATAAGAAASTAQTNTRAEKAACEASAARTEVGAEQSCADADKQYNDELWHQVFEEGEDELGSFNLIRTGTKLVHIGEKSFTVLVKNDFTKKYTELQRDIIEKIMTDKLGRSLQMLCCTESEQAERGSSATERAAAEAEDKRLAEEAGRLLGIEVEVDD